MKPTVAIRGTRLASRDRSYFKPLSRTILYLPPFAWLVLDVAFGLAAFLFAQWATPYRGSLGAASYDPLLAGLAFGAILATFRHVFEAHDFAHLNSLVRILFTSFVSSAAAAALLMFVMNGLLYLKLGRFVAAYAFLASLGLTTLSRVATRGWVARARHNSSRNPPSFRAPRTRGDSGEASTPPWKAGGSMRSWWRTIAGPRMG
jgi:hypothetical protein